MKKPSQEYHNIGDSLRAERITVQAHDIDKPRIVKGSGRDKIQRTILRGSAFCVIEQPMKWILDKK